MFKSPLLESHGMLDVVTQACGQDNDVLMALVHQLAASLGKAIDAKDPHTMAHSEEVAEVSRFLAAAMGLPQQMVTCVHVAGHLHDIGKIGVPDAVLGKPGSLDAQEWECMKAHPAIGAEILLPLVCIAQTGIVAMVQAHHERYDGCGYPLGLCGRAIPLGARIISVADSLSAMLQTRPYRPAMTFDAARQEIARCSGSQFDPDVVDTFLAVAENVRRLLGSCRDGATVP
jgi:HD-GYP domain-containing protein (c-di-GMP phosphodiesterase class II)